MPHTPLGESPATRPVASIDNKKGARLQYSLGLRLRLTNLLILQVRDAPRAVESLFVTTTWDNAPPK